MCRLSTWLVGALALSLVLVLASAPRAQKAAKLVGFYKLKPGLLHPVLREQIKGKGKPLEDLRFTFHKSVPAKVWLRPGKRKEHYWIHGDPPLRIKQFVVPTLLNLQLRYDRKHIRTHRWEVTETDEGVLMKSHSGVFLKLRGFDVMFVDLNHDGAFGSSNDGYVIKPRRKRQWAKPGEVIEFRPMPMAVDFADGKVWFEVDPWGFKAIVTFKKPDYSVQRREEYGAALKQLNAWRAELGSDPVELDMELSVACEKHCLYCSMNGSTHHEERMKPGYSKDGERAGRRSELVQATTMKQAFNHWLDSFYHRIVMLRPDLQKVGMGLVSGFACVDTRSGLTNKSFGPYAWPPDGATAVPVGWNIGESPSPLGESEPFTVKEAMAWGYPITLTFSESAIEQVKAELRDTNGNVQKIFLSTPEKPGNKKVADNLNTVFLMRRSKLSSKTTYVVTVDCQYRGKPYHKQWQFTTR